MSYERRSYWKQLKAALTVPYLPVIPTFFVRFVCQKFSRSIKPMVRTILTMLRWFDKLSTVLSLMWEQTASSRNYIVQSSVTISHELGCDIYWLLDMICLHFQLTLPLETIDSSKKSPMLSKQPFIMLERGMPAYSKKSTIEWVFGCNQASFWAVNYHRRPLYVSRNSFCVLFYLPNFRSSAVHL